MDSLFPTWPLIGGNAAILFGLGTIAGGLVACFFGYRLFRVLLALYGAVIGGLMGVALAYAAAPEVEVAALVGGVLGAIAGAVVLAAFYLVGVFVLGALGGLLVIEALAAAAGVGVGPGGAMTGFGTLLRLLAAALGGAAALVAQRLVIIVATALTGAWIALGGAASLLGLGPSALFDPLTSPPAEGPWRDLPEDLLLIAWLVVAALGIVTQGVTAPPRSPEKSAKGSRQK